MKVTFFTLDRKHLGDVSLLLGLTGLIFTPLIVHFKIPEGFILSSQCISLCCLGVFIIGSILGLSGLFQKHQSNKYKSIAGLTLSVGCSFYWLLMAIIADASY